MKRSLTSLESSCSYFTVFIRTAFCRSDIQSCEGNSAPAARDPAFTRSRNKIRQTPISYKKEALKVTALGETDKPGSQCCKVVDAPQHTIPGMLHAAGVLDDAIRL